MKLIQFDLERDFDTIKNCVTDERTHAMWCANRFIFPLEKENFSDVLSRIADQWGDIPFCLLTDNNETAGFFCYSLNSDTKEGMIKFLVVNPEFRGKGVAGELLRLASEYAFENGAELVHLNVFPENSRAMKCYLKAGFTQRKLTENAFTYKDESWRRCNMVLTRNK